MDQILDIFAILYNKEASYYKWTTVVLFPNLFSKIFYNLQKALMNACAAYIVNFRSFTFKLKYFTAPSG